MASITTPEVDIVIKPAATWGTAIDVTAATAGLALYASAFTINDGFGEFQPRDIGFDNFITNVIRLERSVTLSFTSDLSFHGGWLFGLALFQGGDTVTGAGPEYTHTMDMVSSIFGKFATIAMKVEDDYAIEFPSVKFTSITISLAANGVGTVSFNAMADRVVQNASVVNTISKINSTSYPTYDAKPLGDTNHYFRMNAASGGGLSGSNDLQILNMSLTMSRPFDARRVLRAANTKYTLEPRQKQPTVATLQVQLAEINDGALDGYNEFDSQTAKKAEIFIDGAVIGGGSTNASLKIQLPRLLPSQVAGYNVPNNASEMQPSYTYQIVKASSAPTGMTGVTNYARFVAITEKSSAYV